MNNKNLTGARLGVSVDASTIQLLYGKFITIFLNNAKDTTKPIQVELAVSEDGVPYICVPREHLNIVKTYEDVYGEEEEL